jgi:UDP:flavonoid glycosyltransferase YjiC (YdhE family)
MSKILVASVPLSGHINPAIPLVKMLIDRGHEIIWYSGAFYKENIEATGAKFIPFCRAKDFHDSSISGVFPGIPHRSLFRHASYYIKHVFYDNMPGQYSDLLEILKEFPADILLTDEWFTGAIPLAVHKTLRWVCYCNSPLFYYSDEIPFPGAGIFPSTSVFGINRNRIVNLMVTKIFFAGVQKYINRVRKQCNLLPMDHFFLINNIFTSDLFIKFNTLAFEFNWKDLPDTVRFVGPVLPEHSIKPDYKWEGLLKSGKPVIFITQGSVNITDNNQLIIPALKATKGLDALVIVATGNSESADLVKEFGAENVFIEPYIPYGFIMPYTDLIITNGGFGGVITALNYGVPMIVAADTEDKPEIAARIEYCRVGINLGTGHPKPGKIRKAIHKVLLEKNYKENAAAISRDFQKHNAPLETTKLIEEILSKTGR